MRNGSQIIEDPRSSYSSSSTESTKWRKDLRDFCKSFNRSTKNDAAKEEEAREGEEEENEEEIDKQQFVV